MRTLVTATVLGLGLLTSGTAMANDNFGGSPLYNPQYPIMALHIIMGVTQAIGTITPGIQTTIPAIATLTATRTMGGIRGARTLTGIPRPHRILIRRPTLIGYPMSAGAEPSASAPRGELRRIGLIIEV
jgi:hypothetical protein